MTRAVKPAVAAAAVAALAAIPVLSSNIYTQNVLIMTFLLAVLASGWNIIGGYAGYISLGHSAFIGVGAYTAGILANRWGVSPLLVARLGGVAAAFVALLLSLTTRRTRGAAFVIVTFAMLELLGLIASNWKSLTGGADGLVLPLPSWSVDIQNWPFYYALLGLLVLSVLMSLAIRRSKLGLGLVAIRDDEDKAAGIGVTTPVYKGLAFMASAVLVGVAGAVYGYYVSYLDTSAMFDITLSVEVVLAALIGGRGTVWGPVLGAAIVQPLIEVTNSSLGGANAGAVRLLLFGGLLVAVALLLPRGVLPELERLVRRLRGRPEASPTGARLTERPVPAFLRGSAPPAAVDGPAPPPLLSVSALTKRFGGVTALDGTTFGVRAGSITALIGPNGSGKTTAFNVIDGTYTATSGTVTFDGHDVTGWGRTRRAFAGMGRTYQLPRLFDSLTVLENVAAVTGEFRLRTLFASAVSGAEAARATELLEFVGLGDYVHARASDLSYGQRKLVELAQVLMLDPAVILLDEPAAGINPTLVRRLADLIRALNDTGRTFVVVEHDMHFVLSLCDPVVVLSRGTVIADGKARAVSTDPAVLEAYLGDDFVPDEISVGSPG
ncbi:MAG: branched-chain amino acid ABC transporter ATP-binding protein/permease [Actinomycetota bacterium]|nr:branched-chain amino acid ABC transporter ATP-binding protein/permease [Actinomycetota bacterium]